MLKWVTDYTWLAVTVPGQFTQVKYIYIYDHQSKILDYNSSLKCNRSHHALRITLS